MKNRSFRYSVQAAIRGIVHVYTHEKNFRLEIWLASAAMILLVSLGAKSIDYALIFLTITLVLVAEVVNTAIERAVDIMKPHKHPYARVIKDLSAGFVLMASIGAVIVGMFVYVPLLLQLLSYIN